MDIKCSIIESILMTIEQTLLQGIEESKMRYDREKEECIYKRNLGKRIELINWTLDNLKNPDIDICILLFYVITFQT